MSTQYNPDVEPVRQRQDWTCSVCSATFLLNSIGDPVTSAEMQDAMQGANLVTPQSGLLDGSGAALTQFLARESGCETGNRPNVSWDWIAQHAGTMPIAMGSPSLYHWVAVRKVNDDGTLALANPAPGYRGVYDTMTEQQFEDWQPWNAVYIQVPQDDPDSHGQPTEDDSMADAALTNLLGYLKGDVKDALQAALDGARAAKTVKQRADAFDALQAAINTLAGAG